jgi:uncharacterized protein (TIGR03118 family)
VIGNTTASSFFVSITQGGVTTSGKAIFLFATQDGTISGWNPAVLPTTAVIGANRSNFGASYTALTIFTNSIGTSFLYAANNVDGGGIDMFNGDFTFLRTFNDPQIPQKFAPYGIRVINDQLWVTFAGTNKANSGFVDVFHINTDGTLTKLFEANGPLHSPWGLALAPRISVHSAMPFWLPTTSKTARSTPSIQAMENSSDTSPMETAGRSRSINCGDWISAKAPAPTAPRTNSSLPPGRITMPTDYSA